MELVINISMLNRDDTFCSWAWSLVFQYKPEKLNSRAFLLCLNALWGLSIFHHCSGSYFPLLPAPLLPLRSLAIMSKRRCSWPLGVVYHTLWNFLWNSDNSQKEPSDCLGQLHLNDSHWAQCWRPWHIHMPSRGGRCYGHSPTVSWWRLRKPKGEQLFS